MFVQPNSVPVVQKKKKIELSSHYAVDAFLEKKYGQSTVSLS